MGENNFTTRQFTDNQALALQQKLVFETAAYEGWGKWFKFNTPKKQAVDPNRMPSVTRNAPIVVHRELEKGGHDHISVPMFRSLLNKPKYGEQQMKEHEEKQKVNTARVYINTIRHAMYTKHSGMSALTTKQLDIAKWAKPQLQDHYAKVNARLGVSYAFYNGFSENILDDSSWYTGDGANAPSAVSHPHIYVPGTGKVSYGATGFPGTATYETSIGTAISAMDAAAQFDTELLSGLRAESDIRKIPFLTTKDGMGYRVIAAHPYQLAQLVADENFRATQNAAMAQNYAKENPYLVGCKYIWEDWAIFDLGHLVWPVEVSGGKPVWGYNGTWSSLEDLEDWSASDTFAAIIFGDNAMAKATGTAMNFFTREDDYGAIKAIDYDIIEGFARNEYWNRNDGTAGAYIKNTSSALVITKSSKPTY